MSRIFIDDSGVIASFVQLRGVDSGSHTTYTFSSATLDPNATIHVVAITWVGAAAPETLSSATIDGVSATIAVQTADDRTGVALVYAPATGDSSGNISFTISGSGSVSADIATFSLIGATASAATYSSTANPLTATASVGAGGAVIGASHVAGSPSAVTMTWSGITERYDSNYFATGQFSGAMLTFDTANASLSLSATPSGTVSRKAAVFAVFNP